MSDNKFSVESDFVDSYLNSLLISSLPSTDYNLRAKANIFSNCVNLVNLTLKTQNCSEARDSLAEIIESEDFKSSKEKVLGECSESLLLSHRLYYELNSKSHSPASYLTLSGRYHIQSQDLKNCMKNNGVGI